MWNKKPFLGVLLAVSTIGTCHVEAATYTLTDLGDLSGGQDHSAAFAINNLGQVVGIGHDAYGKRAVLWDNGVMANLGRLDASHGYSIAHDINDHGDIVGQSESSAFLYHGGTITDLGTLGGSYAIAGGINNSGQIVGIASNIYGVTHAFLFSEGTMEDLNPGGSYSRAYSINDSGQVTGVYAEPSGVSRGFIWDNGTASDLGTLFGESGHTTAFAINENGQAVGYSGLIGETETHPFIWQDGVMTDLGDLSGTPGSSDYARGINNLGTVVGMSRGRGFIWDDALGMRDLNDLLDDSAIGWEITHPYDINDNGQIVGMGINADGNSRAFLLSPNPVPEPTTFVLWSGLGAMGLLGWRRRN